MSSLRLRMCRSYSPAGQSPGGIFRGRLLDLLRVLAAPLLSGCVPLPIPHTELVTPAIVGAVRESDGSPVVGLPVSVTTGEGDVGCDRAVARAVTDSSGSFRMPRITKHMRIYWLSMMERFDLTWYWFCPARVDSSGTGRAVEVDTRRIFITGRLGGDTLDCLRWAWREAYRLTCERKGRGEWPRIITGGRWSEGAERGYYRLLFADSDTWGNQARAFVQWVATPTGGEPQRIRAVAELPTPEDVQVYGATLLEQSDGRWRVTVKSVRPTTWGNDKSFSLDLGRPGEIVAATDRAPR